MKPVFVGGNIRADCPDCGVPSTFEYRNPDKAGKEFGEVILKEHHKYENADYPEIVK